MDGEMIGMFLALEFVFVLGTLAFLMTETYWPFLFWIPMMIIANIKPIWSYVSNKNLEQR